MTKLDADWLVSDGTQRLFKLFGDAGHQLYCVGGCVRNALLCEEVADLDMATNARPEQVQKLAERAGLKTIPTGIAHGTLTVMSDDVPYEITTFRNDVSTDGRRATVAYSDSLQDDAQRRDFTINALYVGADGAVIDTVGGLQDLAQRRVRFIGDAHQRIAEDYLRILRFFRFYAWYGDTDAGIDADGLAACADGAEGIDRLSKERIGAEMCKLLAAADPAPAVASMQQTGILARVMPGADAATLAVLVHLEDGFKPDWKRRALALGGENLKDHWRISKADADALDQARADLQTGTRPGEMAYRNGADHARNVAYVLAASMQQPPTADLEAQIAQAASAHFPVNAADLMPDLQGAALGQRLVDLKTRWIASGFTLSREELLAQ